MDAVAALSGWLAGPLLPWSALATALVFVILGYFGAPFLLWALAALVALVGFGAPPVVIGVAAVLTLIFGTPLRRLVSALVLGTLKRLEFLPRISATEKVALAAGNVWAEQEFFSGRPSFARLRSELYPELTDEERAFLEGPVETVCRMVDDQRVMVDKDLSPEVWAYLKRERFFGMIIPKEHGGLGFSAKAHSEVIQKLGSRSVTLCITVMVPNSLGPAELLIHYGTEEEKAHYLPRLANGEDIPAFALTEPGAGSDAGAISSSGVVFRGDDGELYLRLNWNKRWITLAAVSTVLGLAFRLRDPEHLLGDVEDLGITCALIPTSKPGVVLGRRHDPLGVPFYNCPTQGHDVVVPVDAIIGGRANAGRGWIMLMESLAAGRGISLPALSTGASKVVSRVASAHAVIRKQFGVSIGKFEGIEEPLARIGAMTYLLDAMRNVTLGAIDSGVKPPVVTAIAKYHSTEMMRRLVNDGLDIRGGAGISRGPRNVLANAYFATPIGITVEGANILTRTLMIFGQGALRAHPFAKREVESAERGDVVGFDRAFWGHIGLIVQNTVRTVVLSATRGWLYTPPVRRGIGRDYQKLAWTSAAFAITADLAMGLFGGRLKMKESITGRFADILSWLYIGSAVLRRYEHEGFRREDLPYVRWAMSHAFFEIQRAFDGILGNFDVPWVGWVFRGPLRFWSQLNAIGHPPSDAEGHRVARSLQVPDANRERLTDGIYVPTSAEEALGRLERAMLLCAEAEALDRKLKKAVRARKLPRIADPEARAERAVAAGVWTPEEAETFRRAESARDDAIQVDSYSLDEYRGVSIGTAAVEPPPHRSPAAA
ncbi:MAG: acyl-CoA dehydrogenase [Sandaracinaceae bacterium]